MIISGKTRSVVVLRASGRDEEEIGGDYMRSRCKLLLHSQLTSSDRGSHYHKPTHTHIRAYGPTHTRFLLHLLFLAAFARSLARLWRQASFCGRRTSLAGDYGKGRGNSGNGVTTEKPGCQRQSGRQTERERRHNKSEGSTETG